MDSVNLSKKIADAYPDFKGDKKKSYESYRRKIRSNYSTELKNTSNLKNVISYVLLNLLGQILLIFGNTITVTGKYLNYDVFGKALNDIKINAYN